MEKHLMKAHIYSTLEIALNSLGIAHVRQPDRIVCAMSKSERVIGGPSLWVTHDGVSWVVATWTPRIYRVNAERSDVGQVSQIILDALRYCSSPFYDISEVVKRSYKLCEIADDDIVSG
jgi:hypothetical protein